MPAPEPLRVAFVHPDLGLGGAERLVIDAALALQARGHSVAVYTPHLDADRCFPEVHPDNAELRVRVVRQPFPRHVAGRLHVRRRQSRTNVEGLGLHGSFLRNNPSSARSKDRTRKLDRTVG